MTNPDQPDSGRPRDVADLSDSQVMNHLHFCRELTLDYTRRALPGFWEQWTVHLEEYAERARSNKEQTAFYECKRTLDAAEQELIDEICRRLSNGFTKFKNKLLNTLTGEERFSGDMLSLVEHSDLEETIAITSITHRADSYYAGYLWSLQQRLALLNNGDKPDERSNPISPVQFCEALRKALLGVSLDNKTKIIGYKTFDTEVIGSLDQLYEEINSYFIDHDLLPNLNYASALEQTGESSSDNGSEQTNSTDGAAPQRRSTDRLLSGASSAADQQYQAGLYSAIRLLQSHLAQPPAVGSTPYNPELDRPYRSEQLVNVLQNLQTQALDQSQKIFAPIAEAPLDDMNAVAPQSIQQVSQQILEQVAAQSEESGTLDSRDLATIDLVGLLFEYMLSDDNLPDSIKALLSYLHTPFLKMAFIDKDFFEQTDHPARVLLNSLAESGSRWVSNDGSSQYDMYNKIKSTVFRLLAEFKNDVRLFAEILLEFNSYTNNLARRQEMMEKRALEKVQGEERLREAKQRVNEEVRTRTDHRELPSAVLLLLLQPWSDYLAFVILRYGERSDSWRQSLNVMDELLWTLEPKTLDSDKAQQLEVQDGVIRALQTGFDSIGYDQAKGRKLLEAVVSLQKMAMQSRRAEPAPLPMREKLESIASEKAGQSKGKEEPVTQEEQKIVANLKMIEFGTWFEYEGGKRLKVAWYNKRTLHYMLVDQQGRKVAMNSGLQLARDMIGGRARIIAGSTKPFFERALENIYQQLNSRAVAQPQDFREGNDD